MTADQLTAQLRQVVVSALAEMSAPDIRLNKKQAQEYLGVGYRRLNTMIQKGLISPGKDGRFSQKQLETILQ